MLNIKFCVVLETEDGIISSSHDGWGMTKYHVQGCMALLCTASLFFLGWDVATASLWYHKGAPFPPHTKASCTTQSRAAEENQDFSDIRTESNAVDNTLQIACACS